MYAEIRHGISCVPSEDVCQMNPDELRQYISNCRYCGEFEKVRFEAYPQRPMIIVPSYIRGGIPLVLSDMLDVSGLMGYNPYLFPLVRCEISPRENVLKSCSPFARKAVEILKPLYIIVYGMGLNKYIEPSATTLFVKNVEFSPRDAPRVLDMFRGLYRGLKNA